MEYKRHICNVCKRKLRESKMFETDLTTRYGYRIWLCYECKGRGESAWAY